MGLVRAPLGGDANVRHFPVLPQFDTFTSEKAGMQPVDFANAAQAVSPTTPTLVLQTTGASVSMTIPAVPAPPMPVPLLPAPMMTAICSGTGVSRGQQSLVPPAASPATLTALEATPSSAVRTVTTGLTQPSLGVFMPQATLASPVAFSPFAVSTASAKAQTSGLSSPTSGTVHVQRLPHTCATIPAMTRPTPIGATFSGSTLDTNRLSDKETGHLDSFGLPLPLRAKLGARRPAPHSRRIRRPRRSRSMGPMVTWYEAWSPSSANISSEAVAQSGHWPESPKVLIWHCRHAHGLFSMFSLALGHMETCEKHGMALIVDWSSDELLYRGPPGEPNVWNAFFCQPAELKMSPEVLRFAVYFGQCKETSSHSVIYGNYRGVIQDYGGIPPEQAARGRALCKRNIRLRPRFQKKLQNAVDVLAPGRRLAVHIRRSDKACEAAANFELSDSSLLERIARQCAAWKMDGVFLCTDDASLKRRLTDALEKSGLSVSTYSSTLPADAAKAVHFDTSLDSYKKAEDVVIEAFLMAKGCHGLLSTYSNVSATVVYLSPEDYPYTTFWDPLEAKQDVMAGLAPAAEV